MPSLFRGSSRVLGFSVSSSIQIPAYFMVENMIFTCICCLAIYEVLFIQKKILK